MPERPEPPHRKRNRLRVRLAYWKQWAWFYAWRWSQPWPWLHVKTIRPTNIARQDYVEIHRKLWCK